MKKSTILKNFNILNDAGVHSYDEIYEIFEKKGVSRHELNEAVAGAATSRLWDFGQQVLQGMSFGYGDEIEAQLRAAFKGTSYDDELPQVRAEIEEFRKENPGLALTSEVAGAFLIPGFALSKLIQIAPRLGQYAKGEKLLNALKRSIAGGIAGTFEAGIYGTGTAETDPEKTMIENIPERLESGLHASKWGGLLGMGLGPTVGAGAEMLGEKISRMAGRKSDRITDLDGNEISSRTGADSEAKQAMLTAAQMDDVSGLESLNKTLDRMIEIDPDLAELVTVADLYPKGGFGQGLAELTAKTPGQGMATAERVYGSRAEMFPELTRKMIEKNLGKRVQDVEKFRDWLVERATQLAKPHYRKAEPQVVDIPPLVDHAKRLMEKNDQVGRIFKKAWNATRLRLPRLLQDKGINFPSFGPKPEGPVTVLHWDTLKKAVDDEIKGLSKSGKAFSKLDMGYLEAFYSDVAKRLADAVPEYGKATRLIHSAHRYKDAFDSGMKAQKNKSVTPEEMKSQLSEFRGGAEMPEEKIYKLGYAWGMYEKILNKNVINVDPKKTLQLLTEDQPEKMRVLFRSPEVAEQFLRKIDMIAKMNQLGNKLRYGSPTYPLQAMREVVKGEPGLISKGVDIYRSMKGPGSAAKAVDQSLIDKKSAQTLENINPMINTPGVQMNRQILQNLGQYQNRVQQQLQNRGRYPAGLMGTLSPIIADRDYNPLLY